MRTFCSRNTAALITVLVIGSPAISGDLNPPPGPVTATMKSLDQVEPRIPVNAETAPGDAAFVHVISAPGSYFLEGNVVGVAGKGGIRVDASDVTLDLMGFAIVGDATTLGSGVKSDQPQVVVRNGHIRRWIGDGVDLFSAEGAVLADLQSAQNTGYGARVGANSIVTGCQFSQNGDDGLSTYWNCVVTACSAFENAGDGVSASAQSIVSECTARDNAQNGFIIITNGIIRDCIAMSNGSRGIRSTGGGIVERCVARANDGVGIEASASGTIVRACTSEANLNGYQIAKDCRVEGSVARGNDVGFFCEAGTSLHGCTASENDSYGFRAFVGGSRSVSYTECTASGNGLDGFEGGTLFDRCKSLSNGRHGFYLAIGANIEGSNAEGNVGDGIRSDLRAQIRNNHCRGNGAGVVVDGALFCRVEGNTCIENTGAGFDVSGAFNLVIGNFAVSNSAGSDFVIGAGSSVGPIVTPATIGTNTNPSANYGG